MNAYAAIMYLAGLALLVLIIELISRPAKHNPNVKGLSMHHWEGPDR